MPQYQILTDAYRNQGTFSEAQVAEMIAKNEIRPLDRVKSVTTGAFMRARDVGDVALASVAPSTPAAERDKRKLVLGILLILASGGLVLLISQSSNPGIRLKAWVFAGALLVWGIKMIYENTPQRP